MTLMKNLKIRINYLKRKLKKIFYQFISNYEKFPEIYIFKRLCKKFLWKYKNMNGLKDIPQYAISF